jgi:hypothetical protein
MAAAYGLRRSGLEQQANSVIESKIGWAADPDLVQASEAMEKSKYDEAANILLIHLKRKPATPDALQLLQEAQWRQSNMPSSANGTSRRRMWTRPGELSRSTRTQVARTCRSPHSWS